MKVTILGCGSSTGVPHLACGWGQCDPNNQKNRRTRSSILVEHNGITALIDTSPDLREQLFRLEKMPTIDAVFLSHAHFDHAFGLGELRPVFYGRNVPLFARQDVLEYIKSVFLYLFESDIDIYRPVLTGCRICKDMRICKDGQVLAINAFDMSHGYSNSTGFRIDNFAYTTDVVSFPQESFEQLYGLDVWIVDCLSKKNKPAHANIEQVLKWVDELKPKMTYLTHMDFTMDYDTLLSELPDNIRPAYDGLEIRI